MSHPCPIDLKAFSWQPPPKELLFGCAASIVVKESGAFIKPARVRRIWKPIKLEIKLMAKLVTKRANEGARRSDFGTAVRIQIRMRSFSGS
jgi:hypothetical protein